MRNVFTNNAILYFRRIADNIVSSIDLYYFQAKLSQKNKEKKNQKNIFTVTHFQRVQNSYILFENFLNEVYRQLMTKKISQKT
jgi:GTP-dependent phosphoenolpyruvate carboxykinase